MTYIDRLRDSARQTRSIACLGLDPVLEAIPEPLRRAELGVNSFFDNIFDEMESQKVFPGAFKPNAGFYLKHDSLSSSFRQGTVVLVTAIKQLKQRFPHIPIIFDYKRGDIATSSANYAEEGFDVWRADAVTVSPYMGTDSVMPFIEKATRDGKGVYILNRTSNPGAKDFQNLMVDLSEHPEREYLGRGRLSVPLYEVVAGKIVQWSQGHPGVGAVVGATSLEELTDIARIYGGKDIAWLIPGVGGQGGKANEVRDRLVSHGIDLELVRINSSSAITHPWEKKKQPAPKDYPKVCVEQLFKLNEEIGYKVIN